MDKKKLILTIIAIILFLIVLVLAYLLFQNYHLMKWGFLKIDQDNHYQNGKTMPAFDNWHHKEQH